MLNPLYAYLGTHKTFCKIWFSLGVVASTVGSIIGTLLLGLHLVLLLFQLISNFVLQQMNSLGGRSQGSTQGSSTTTRGVNSHTPTTSMSPPPPPTFGDTQPILTPLLPGVNIPVSYLGFILAAVVVSALLHELGHAVAVAAEGSEVHKTGFLVALFVPGAYVQFDESVAFLKPWSQLRIYYAGVWHNVILALICFVLTLFVPTITRTWWPTCSQTFNTECTWLIGIDDESLIYQPLAEAMREQLTTQVGVTAINHVEVSSPTIWFQTLTEMYQHQDQANSYCVPHYFLTRDMFNDTSCCDDAINDTGSQQFHSNATTHTNNHNHTTTTNKDQVTSDNTDEQNEMKAARVCFKVARSPDTNTSSPHHHHHSSVYQGYRATHHHEVGSYACVPGRTVLMHYSTNCSLACRMQTHHCETYQIRYTPPPHTDVQLFRIEFTTGTTVVLSDHPYNLANQLTVSQYRVTGLPSYLFGHTFPFNLQLLLYFTFSISLGLAVLNVTPVPLFDGEKSVLPLLYLLEKKLFPQRTQNLQMPWSPQTHQLPEGWSTEAELQLVLGRPSSHPVFDPAQGIYVMQPYVHPPDDKDNIEEGEIFRPDISYTESHFKWKLIIVYSASLIVSGNVVLGFVFALGK